MIMSSKKVKIIEPTKELSPIPPVESSGERMLAVIEKASTDPRCNIEKMRALLDMKMEMIREERRLVYNSAMWEAQGEMTPIVAKAWNESTKSFFAKLAHVDNVVRPIIRKFGFSLSFDSHKEADGTITFFIDIMHTGGHTERRQLNAAVDSMGPKGTPNKTQPQGVKSTATICQRELIVMAFNLSFINEDDDGQGGKKVPVTGGADRFSSSTPPAQTVTPEPRPIMPLAEAADLLEQKLKAEPDIARKGEILMKNIKIIAELDDNGDRDRAHALRKLAEGTKNA